MAAAEPLLDRARACFTAGSWRESRDLLLAADAAAPLALDDLERLALAAYLSGGNAAATEAWTRAMRGAAEQGDPRRAARQAVRLGADLAFRGEFAPAMGWFARAGSLLDGCAECAEHAWLRTFAAIGQMFGGDPAGAGPALAEGVAAGRRFGDRDLVTISQLGQGQCLVMQGQAGAGTTLLDEVMVAVTSGEVFPLYAGIAYCAVIATCWDSFDLRRAREWTVALTRWCDAQPDLVPFRGNCLIHRCELMALQGEWVDAVATARLACDQLSGPVTWDSLGAALYQLGELQRLRGEFDAAEESYRRAADAGREPQPGLALLRLAQGRVGSAVAVMHRVLAETLHPAGRCRLLPAHVEVMIAAGDVPLARCAAEELAGIAAERDTPYLHALAATATGAVRLAEGDPRAALSSLRSAAEGWRRLDAPREVARIRVLVALACRALDDVETAGMELDGARREFERLGAAPDLEWLRALTATSSGSPGGLTAREIGVLRLIAAGRTNRTIGKELGIAEKTVARHVSNIFVKIDVGSRAAATAYAYEHGLV